MVEPEQRALKRIVAWRASLSARSDPRRFSQRLRYLGRTEGDLLKLLADGNAKIFPSPVDRIGPRLLEEGLQRLESEAALPCDAEIPFGEIFAPLASAVAGVWSRELLRMLAETSAPALVTELRNAPDYHSFAAGLRAGGLRELLGRWPVLARLLAQCVRQAHEAAREFDDRLEADRVLLSREFPAASGSVAMLEFLGDAHRAGRRVMAVTFSGGGRLIYKPRSLRTDVAWHAMIEWLRGRDAKCRLQSPRALDRGEYGWVEFVEPSVPADFAEYYRRAGELLALAWLCGGSDFHEENVIATAEGPVLVDFETLFTPVPRPFGATDEELAQAGDEPLFGTGVLSTLLLPVWQVDEQGRARDLSGLGGRRRTEGNWHEPQWVDLGTLQLREEMRPAAGTLPLNLPRDAEGLFVTPDAYTSAVRDGFTAAVLVLLAAREEIPFEAFRGVPIRFLVRNTQIYGVMRRRLLAPEFLRADADRSIEIEKLARPFFPQDFEADCPEVFLCYEAERRGLENGDFPSFYAANDETTLHGDGGVAVRNYFWKTGWQVAQERLRRLDQALVSEQAALVQGSLEMSRLAPTAPPGDLLGAAVAIAEDLSDRVIPLHTGGVSWLSLGFDPVRKMQTASLMGMDVYSGSLGVAIFLAALARVTGEPRWRTLAIDATRIRLDQMREAKARRILSRLPLGVGSGLGSLVYGCQLAAQLLNDESYLDDAMYFAGLIGEAKPAGDVHDVLGGEAGAILALLNLHEQTGDAILLETAIGLGHRILEKRTATSAGCRVWQPEFAIRPLTGLGHGAAGFAWALDRLGKVSGERVFSAGAGEAVAYEREVFVPEARNWPDYRRNAGLPGTQPFMHGWCAGPPGIGLARLAQCGGDTDDIRAEVDAAIQDALAGPRLTAAHLCCGEAARIEFLLTASAARNDPTLRTAAWKRAEEIASQQREQGFYPLNGAARGKLFAPSFFQGTTGICYSFLRLLDDSLPSVASLELGFPHRPRPCSSQVNPL